MQPTCAPTEDRDRRSARRGRFAVLALAAAPVVAGAWLFLAAIPALADGGPHISSVNSGTGGLTADSCAGCHRAHTAQGEYLLKEAEEELCLSCHGAAGTGATTDVESGLQYTIADRTAATPILGALRNGGFVDAAISSGNPSRVLVENSLDAAAEQLAKVQVRTDGSGAVAPAPVTSAHLNLPQNGLSAPGVAWGNGAIGLGFTGAGPTVTMSCASCHNPHGNGQYRILNEIPEPMGAGFDPIPNDDFLNTTVKVTDSPLGGDVDPVTPGIQYATKNYTVIQVKGPTYLLYASQVSGVYGPTTGDYWHVRVPWNSTSGANDAPNGIPTNATGGLRAFNEQITNWCRACHTRYYSEDGGEPSGDALFTYRHETTGNRACTTCHVAHGSNAAMYGPSSSVFPYPDDPATEPAVVKSSSSRLLKVDNRGTCQLCHDPTYTFTAGQPAGPTPTPGVP